MNGPVTVAAVGDLMPGDSAICVGYGFASATRDVALDDVLRDTTPLLRAADIAIGNLETPISRRGLRPRRWSSRQMRGLPRHALELRRAGFDVLNIANNHALQHGLPAFRETVELLQDAGIRVCGLRGADEWTALPVEMSVRGQTIGILGYSMRPRQYTDEKPPYAEATEERIVADVARLAHTATAVLVSLHWGEEFVAQPSEAEVALAHRIIDAGAAAVLGHHPHVLRPVESYGNGVIAYSLGNLLCDMIWHEPLRHGGVLQLDLSGGGARVNAFVETRVDDAFVPGIMDDQKQGPPTYSLEPLDAADYARQADMTVAAQRSAAYAYAVRNLQRYPPVILAQFAGRTVYNKISGVLARGRSG